MASTIATTSTDLAALLKRVCRVSARKAAGIYSHLLIAASQSGLEISANNGQQQITLSAPVGTYSLSGSGDQFCVQAAKLVQIVSALPRGAEVTLTHSDGKVRIVSGRARFTLVTLPAKDFLQMALADEDANVCLSVDGDLISGALRQVGFCAGRTDVRHYLNGVLFELSSGRLTLAASDGYRLGVVELSVDGVADASFILPSSGIEDVVLFCAATRVEITSSAKLVRYAAPAGVLYSTLVDGEFPDYRRLVDAAEKGASVQVAKNDMADALARVALLSHGSSPVVRIACQGDNLTLQSVAGDDVAQDILPCSYSGGPFELGLQVSLAGEVVRALGSEKINFHFNGAASGTLLRATDFSSHSFVLMPVRL